MDDQATQALLRANLATRKRVMDEGRILPAHVDRPSSLLMTRIKTGMRTLERERVIRRDRQRAMVAAAAARRAAGTGGISSGHESGAQGDTGGAERS